MRTKKHFIILLVLSIFLLFGTSCIIHRHRPHAHPRGQIITTKPYGRVNRERHEHKIKIIDARHARSNAHDVHKEAKKHKRDK